MKAKTVYVGMSGGVDSSVTAALLKQQGYTVVGVYMKNWTQDLPGMPCPWKEDYQDAKRVAVQLGIDFKVYDFQTEYRQKVVDYMIAEYQAGRTPNPDIMCNQEVKFKLFLEAALEDGADFIATGHYARVGRSQGPEAKSQAKDNSHSKLVRNPAALFVAANAEKDQTYFLYRVTQEALSRSLMPIGEFRTKAEVRALAKELGLVTADKKDSQGICFVGKVGIKDFLKEFLAKDGPDGKTGVVKDRQGQVVGEHDGAIFYTIGQRHGLDIGGGLPHYVTGKDMAKNEVYVTTDLDDANLWKDTLRIASLHWINEPPLPGRTYQARTRYRAPLVDCTVALEADEASLVLTDKVRAVTPGQSVVIYDGERVVGGGILV